MMSSLRAARTVCGHRGDRQQLPQAPEGWGSVSALGWGRRGRGSLRGPEGVFIKAHSTDHNLAFPFDNMTLPRYQPHADDLIPLGKILEFTHGPKQKNWCCYIICFLLSKAWRGRCLAVFILSLKSLQLKENLPIF